MSDAKTMHGMVSFLQGPLCLLLTTVFLLSCSTLPSRNVQLYQIPQSTPSERIDRGIHESLRMLGYHIEYPSGDSNQILGLMRVPNDIWNRKYRLSVSKQIGSDGRPALLVSAEHCKGCIVTENDNYAPQRRVSAFLDTFSHLLVQREKSSGSEKRSKSPQEDFLDEFYGRSTKGKSSAPVSEDSVPAAPSKNVTPNAVEPCDEVASSEATISLDRLEVRPSSVTAGSTFDLIIVLTVKDRRDVGDELEIDMRYEIFGDQKKLFSSKRIRMQVRNGHTIKRVEHVQASATAGEYEIHTIVNYRETEKTGKVMLSIH